jgi:hypothetical protein
MSGGSQSRVTPPAAAQLDQAQVRREPFMDAVLKPPQWLLDLLPQAARDLLNSGGWYAVLGVLALVVLLIVWKVLGGMLRALFARQPPPPADDDSLKENLADLDPLDTEPGRQRLLIEGVPARIRLVIVAPSGIGQELEARGIDKLIDRIVPGAGALVKHDRPQVRIWPPQLSQQAFPNLFHRHTILPGPEGKASHWVLVAGQAKIGKQPVLLGLALWADKSNHLGRLTLEPRQWRDVFHIREDDR